MKEFWEACGLKDSIDEWGLYPDLTLDNLFRYAVPKVDRIGVINFRRHYNNREWYCYLNLHKSPWEVEEYGDDPAQALYQALRKVLIGEKDVR